MLEQVLRNRKTQRQVLRKQQVLLRIHSPQQEQHIRNRFRLKTGVPSACPKGLDLRNHMQVLHRMEMLR